jgi:sigma54-dependent transcription regulator
VNDSHGVIRTAAGGTLFLDEIGDLPLDVQPKLLRFLQEGEIQPLGEQRPAKVDVRIIAATNTDLEEMVAQGRFREDLYYRLKRDSTARAAFAGTSFGDSDHRQLLRKSLFSEVWSKRYSDHASGRRSVDGE